ncbi:hypothetical protein K438DRAFT_1984494 [Mycena galopus ATCC 62051]|nr:hypothetical protein K438DRAFT_1984494 [Mycena galopus ATCC 62051]
MAPSLSAPSEVLLTPAEASAMLLPLSPAKIESLARKQTTLGTSEGPITDESFASILSRATISFSSNKTWNMNVEIRPSVVKALEYVTLVFPRSSWAFNVGPGGNFGQISWKTGNKCPKGIEVDIQPGRGTDSEAAWTKTTRSPTDLELVWRVQVWNNQFVNPRTAEYTVSGRPVAWEGAVEIHDLIDAKWTAFARGRDDLVKKMGNNGPTTSMFLAGRRAVFLPNVATQDEGRASEYDDTYKLLSFLSDTDLRFNRVPEVLIYNAQAKTYHPMSFHQLHRLGSGIVMLMTMSPVAFSWGAKQHTGKKADMSWEYRLISITVIGKREEEALCSPSKMVIKRKVVDLDLDDSGDERARKSSGKSKSGAGSGASGSGVDGSSGSGSAGSSSAGRRRGAGGAPSAAASGGGS